MCVTSCKHSCAFKQLSYPALAPCDGFLVYQELFVPSSNEAQEQSLSCGLSYALPWLIACFAYCLTLQMGM